MPHFNPSLDVQDLARVHEITAMPYIRPHGLGAEIYSDKHRTSAGELLRLLIYHCDRFHTELLPQLKVPPVVSGRHKLCTNIGKAERETLRQLARERGWKMNSLMRALIYHHWLLRQEYKASLPGLTYVTRQMVSCALSFAPDRLQPWYYNSVEDAKRIRELARHDLIHLGEVLREHGIREDVAKRIIEAVDGGPQEKDKFAWQGPGISPAAMREAVYKAES